MRTKKLSTTAAAVAAAHALLATPGQAIETHDIRDSNGMPFMRAQIFNTDDGPYFDDEDAENKPQFSERNLSRWEVDQSLAAIQHWAKIIKVIPGQSPAIVNIGGVLVNNAWAFSPLSSVMQGAGTKVQAALTGQDPGELLRGAHGVIGIGRMDFSSQAYIPSQLSMTPQVNLTSVVIHEVAHALGIGSTISGYSQNSLDSPYFPQTLNAWTTHLYDANGKQAKPGQAIYCSACVNAPADDVFDLRRDQGYFSGKHVSEVLAGAMPGIPVRMMTNYFPDKPFLSHIELKNSLMSHQAYRNYVNLMEAEFAALQDLGYTIDRRNLFGYSIYGDGQTLVNNNAFFARNAEGTAYLPNSYNVAPLGLGLHVYGSSNTVVQRADLLSGGAGGAGIRVDGENNSITILPGTRVYADGTYARGVMFAYGKDHTFTQRGDVQALGEHGIAASFDFGNNMLGNSREYRGSYIRTMADEPAPMLDEIDGPLVSTFDLTGRLAGSYAAMHMSENGYVSQINVMRGAVLSGDIRSDYAQVDENGASRLTKLTFGMAPDANGHSTGQPDASFAQRYDGNIVGRNNLSLQLVGGTSLFTGAHEVHDVNVAQGATLTGNGSYLLNTDGRFTNSGTLAPLLDHHNNSITVDGDYLQTPTGRLQVALNNNGAISRLVVNGNAALNGALTIAPQRGWYGSGFSVTSNQWLNTTVLTGSFTKVTTSLESPTLMTSATAQGNNTYAVTFSRATDAYSRYGADANSRQVGAALDQIAGNAAVGLHSLIGALDFSASDGTEVTSALRQLSPSAYASAKGNLVNDSFYARSAVHNRLEQAFGGTPSSPIAVIAYGSEKASGKSASAIGTVAPASTGVPSDDLQRYAAWDSGFGGWMTQSSESNAAKTKSTIGGLMTGIDATVYDDWRAGVLAGYSRSTFKVNALSSSGSSDNYTFGTYAGTEWAMPKGAIAFRSGLAYTWHDLEMSRSVAFPGFSDKLTSDYDAGTFQIFGELGYRAHISDHSLIEPYANLAYVRIKTDGLSEKGLNGATLDIHSGTMDTTLSTLGIRATTLLEVGHVATTARTDLGWRRAFGDCMPLSTASFAAGSSAFAASGASIGKDLALIEAGLDFQLSSNTALGIAYQGQFGSGVTKNGLNANFNVKF
ncbi:autotransporter domain-containing protein [Bradyrhizobium sp. BWA-3-5]|uniref:autotransporter family protein n=1 Tax=Bradyrhizobium sp. BWA-3-5 TaxID=3080013 RepID=UPI00293E7038|nr:autotransporter domain-containing protein [Bradyrhizobium sp. BWA-3-5]WOH63783.1 autotransporter domain-containing protein [Bradyrhizobium sp. BWA-3-5]